MGFARRKKEFRLRGNGGMDYEDYYWGLYRDYNRDPFPHSLVSTKEYLST